MSGEASGCAGQNGAFERIHEAGWLQGTIFKSEATLPPVPAEVSYDPETELLLVVTQSCTVVSRDFAKDPWVEAMVVRPLADYHPKSPVARGEMVRQFVLPLDGHLEYKAITCDINRRFFFERRLLAELSPLGDFELDDKSRRSLAAWVGRYYMRIALPDALVERAKETLFKQIKVFLRGKLPSQEPLHEQVILVYIQWEPKGELTSLEAPYDVKLLFLCERADVAEHVDRALQDLLDKLAATGLRVEAVAQAAGETFVSDLDSYVRLSEWDYLSNLGELGDSALGL